MTHSEYYRKQAATREDAAYGAARLVLIALLIGMLLALLAVPAGAADFGVQFHAGPSPLSSPRGGEDETEKKLIVLAAYAAVDYGQSCEAFYRGGHFANSYELNPVLGERPTRRDMLAFGAAGIGLTWLLSEVLPEPWSAVLVDSVLASERLNVEENRRVQNGERRRMDSIPVVITWRW